MYVRYVVSGVQIGMMKAFLSMKNIKEVDEQLGTILANQFVYDSKSSIEEDIKKIRRRIM